MSEDPKEGTIGSITRSTEEEFQQFKRTLNNLIITPEKLDAHLSRLVEERKEKKKID